MPSDRELVQQALSGNKNAASELLAHHDASLRRWARPSILQSFAGQVDPDDVMQEFFLKICANRFRVLGQWRGLTEEWRESIEPYFAVILKNVIHDYRRQNLSRWHHVEEWYDEEGRRQIGLNDLEDLQVAAHRVMAYEESRAALWRCIERLSDRLRRVVRLYISELPHEEIASSLGIAVNASRARLHRAIKALETCLRQAGHNELSFESV